MISYIDMRLINWAEQVGRGGVYLRGQGSILGKLMDSGGVFIRSTGGGPCIDMQSEEMEQCVNQLPTGLRKVVMEFYLSFDATSTQKAKALHVSKGTMYRNLKKAQALIQESLIKASRARDR